MKYKPSSFYRENIEGYYIKELEKNALRNREVRYNNEPERKLKNKKSRDARKERCGFHGRRNWLPKEIEFLKENYKIIEFEKIAKELNRSLSSIEHKITRLGFRKYNKWI